MTATMRLLRVAAGCTILDMLLGSYMWRLVVPAA